MTNNAGITEHVSSYCHDEKSLYYKTRQQVLAKTINAFIINKVSRNCHDKQSLYYKSRFIKHVIAIIRNIGNIQYVSFCHNK